MSCDNAQGQNELSLGYDRGQLEEVRSQRTRATESLPRHL